MDKITNLISSMNALINSFISNFGINFTRVLVIIFIFILLIFIYFKYFKKENKSKELNINNSVINKGNNVNILNSNK